MKYKEINLDEMKEVLHGWTESTGSNSTREYVYEKEIYAEPKIVVFVYTSIHKDSNVSRSKGQDAIRVCAVNLTAREGWIKTVRVLRVSGWRWNLKKAITRVCMNAKLRLRKQIVPQVNAEMENRMTTLRVQRGMIGTFPVIPVTKKDWQKETRSIVFECSDKDISFPSSTVQLKSDRTGELMTFNQTKVDRDANEEDIYGWHYQSPTGIQLLIIND